MKTITVRKEVLINTGKFENIKIIAEVTADSKDWEVAWSEINNQIADQEGLERTMRIKLPQENEAKDTNPIPF